jgi:hypothetical protein
MNSELRDRVVGWRFRHPSLATLGGGEHGGARRSCAVVAPSRPSLSPRPPRTWVASDFVLFGVIAAVVILAAGVAISRQRQEPSSA